MGTFGVTTPDAAGGTALRALATVEAGDDPMERRLQRQKAITVNGPACRFIDVHIDANPNLKASTGREYKHALNRYILPALGR